MVWTLFTLRPKDSKKHTQESHREWDNCKHLSYVHKEESTLLQIIANYFLFVFTDYF